MAHFTTREQQKAMRSANVTISEKAVREREREKGRIGAHGARGSESPGLAHFSLGWKKQGQGEENDTAGHRSVVRTL